MPRVVILNWRDIKNRNAGGAEVYIFEFAKRLVRDGYSVTWLSSKDPNLPSKETIEGIHVVRQGSWLSVYLLAPLYFIRNARKQTDILIDCENGIPFFSPLYYKGKILTVIHHVHREVFKHYAPNFFIKYVGIFLESLIPFIYKRTQLIAVSESTKNALRSTLHIRQPIEIVPNGIDHKEFSTGTKSTTPLLLYLGRLKKYKRVNVLLTAVALLKDRIPNLHLAIAGTGEEAPSLKKLATSLAIENLVTFEGFVTDQRKRELLKTSWILVYPSIHEGWGISVLEANASGTIAVGANVAGLRDSIQNEVTGLLYEGKDAVALSNSLFDILTNTSLRIQMEQAALRWSEEFDWETSYQKFKSLL